MVPFAQIRDPVGSALGSTLIALVPAVVLLVLLAEFRLSAWQAVIIGSAVTLLLAILVWNRREPHRLRARSRDRHLVRGLDHVSGE